MTRRLRVAIRGAVQGVGFRPFVYRLATEMGLRGWVSNSLRGVSAEIEGDAGQLERLLIRLPQENPPRSSIEHMEWAWLDPIGYTAFSIGPSDSAGAARTVVLPDSATCADCLRDISDPRDRRYRYPFTNCTNCGPRLTIIESLPYDRARTSMKGFTMCGRCRLEYEDPSDRRFHAQPNACPDCGPHLELWDKTGAVRGTCDEALHQAATAIRAGHIVAVKGLGGFHLMVDARHEEAVTRLRRRKNREAKPFALLFPSLESVRAECAVSDLEARLLVSPESPIAPVRRRTDGGQSSITAAVAPGNPYLGTMLPSTPLHHLLMAELGVPVVATSGNRSDEPICTDERDALGRLRGIADLFLVHNRPIVRHVDDSVARVIRGRVMVLRAARGYAPLPVSFTEPMSSVLAVGAHLKNTIAITAGTQAFVSQHIGDLETAQAHEAFRNVIRSFRALYGAVPDRIACDLHPDYLSTKDAAQEGAPVIGIQHHHAHVASCMAEHGLEGPVLGVAWDGTGFGPDGTVWGGEFLVVDGAEFRRAASFRPFRLPGSGRAVREPRRAALGLLYELFGEGLFEARDVPPLHAFTPAELRALRGMLSRGINSPFTSSAGRLFDAVASLVGLRHRAGFEGQAAMELEFAAEGVPEADPYPFRLEDAKRAEGLYAPAFMVDWEPLVRGILGEIERGGTAGAVAAGFHQTLVEIIAVLARRVGLERIVLTGGCFQNRYLLERAVGRLEAEGFRPYWHQRVPPNDGGIALGQIWIAARTVPKETNHVPGHSG